MPASAFGEQLEYISEDQENQQKDKGQIETEQGGDRQGWIMQVSYFEDRNQHQ